MPDTTVNPQITDSVTQINAKVIGEAPAMAMGNLYQTIGNSVAMAAANAVYAQQQANVTYQAATTMGVKTLLTVSTTTKSQCANIESLSEDYIETLIDELQQQLSSLKTMKDQSISENTSNKGTKNVKK